jgi:6,7-dimethyl-8-ribityllumazine synthase
VAGKRGGRRPVIEGDERAGGLRVAVIASRFNEAVTSRLLEGALDALERASALPGNIEVYRVPGAWELPVLARRLAASGRFQAIVALGCIVRGGTPHFEYVCAESMAGLNRVSLDHELPIGLGVLTCDTLEQALERAGGKHGNKGAEAALSAVEMANLLARTPGEP